MPGKNEKPKSTTENPEARLVTLSPSGTARAQSYVAANTATSGSALAKLKELGIVDDAGKLTKPYRS